MARYDKYDPISGGFRAPLAADWDETRVGIPTAVDLDGNGRVVPAAAGADAKAVVVIDHVMAAGDIVDCMTAGEIVEVGLAAGTDYLAEAGGTVGTTAGGVNLGFTVEADRLIVRVKGV